MREYGGILGSHLGGCVARQCTGQQPGVLGHIQGDGATVKVYGAVPRTELGPHSTHMHTHTPELMCRVGRHYIPVESGHPL